MIIRTMQGQCGCPSPRRRARMATVERRKSHSKTVYYVKIRRKEYPPQSAAFHKLSNARRKRQPAHTGHLEPGTLPTGTTTARPRKASSYPGLASIVSSSPRNSRSLKSRQTSSTTAAIERDIPLTEHLLPDGEETLRCAPATLYAHCLAPEQKQF